MRIAQVTLRYGAPGGVETNVSEVSRGLASAGDQVKVYASDLYDESRWERRTEFPAVANGVPVQRFPVYKRLIPGVTMPMMTGLIHALDADRPEVIHAHSHRYGHVLEAAAVARARRIPLIVSTHYHPADRREPGWKRGLLRIQDVMFGSSAYRVAACLIVESRLEARLVAEFAPSDRIRIVPPGIDLDECRPRSGDQPPAGLPERFLLYVGRIAANKGLPVLLEALARIPQRERIPLVLAGRDWGERASLEELAHRLGVSRDLVWLGHVDSASEFRALHRAATMLVLPSEWEAFGLVLLTAMATDLPVIASDVGGVAEVLDGGRAGRLVPYGDAARWAEEIAGLLGDAGRRQALARAGQARVQEFTWARAVAAHRSIYQAAVEGSAAGGGAAS